MSEERGKKCPGIVDMSAMFGAVAIVRWNTYARRVYARDINKFSAVGARASVLANISMLLRVFSSFHLFRLGQSGGLGAQVIYYRAHFALFISQ